MSAREEDAAQLARLIEEVAGNVVPTGHLPFLGEILQSRVRATRVRSEGDYVERLRAGELAGEWQKLLPLITVKESYLFRTPQHFAGLRELLPRVLAARAAERRLRVWSAGCARGEEVATLASILAEEPALAGWDWRVLGTDVDEEALGAARRGVFGARAVARVPAELLARHFTVVDGGWRLSPVLTERVEYRRVNLVEEPFPLPDGDFDFVFLRNVLIYFRPESQRRVVAEVVRRLAPHGFLFVGPSESLWQLSAQVRPIELAGAFCYAHAVPAGPPPVGPGDGSQGSSPRAARAAGPLTTTETGGEPPPLDLAATLAAVTRDLAADRLDAAANRLRAAGAAHPEAPEVHALEGLVRDLRGDLEVAVTRYRGALFLAPALYQVRLLLAECFRRLDAGTAAAQQYREVLRACGSGEAREMAELTALDVPRESAAASRAREGLRLLEPLT